jgi:hypothetical protein
MDIEVKFDGKEIIVTRPGTDFMTAYRKRPESPTLKLTRSWVDPHITSPERRHKRVELIQRSIAKTPSQGLVGIGISWRWLIFLTPSSMMPLEKLQCQLTWTRVKCSAAIFLPRPRRS